MKQSKPNRDDIVRFAIFAWLNVLALIGVCLLIKLARTGG